MDHSSPAAHRPLSALLLGTLAVVSLGGLASAVASPAGAAGTLASGIVTGTGIPGLVAVPAGPFDGPLTTAQTSSVLGGSGTAAGRDALDHAVAGYVRTWVRQPADGDIVDVVLVRFSSSSAADQALDAWNGTLGARAGVTTYPVPSVTGAFGYAIASRPAGGQGTSASYEVDFVTGPVLTRVTVATSTGSLSSADAVAVADRQAALAGGAPWVHDAELAAAVGGALVGLAVLLRLGLGLARGMGRRRPTGTRPEGQRQGQRPEGAHGVGALFGPRALQPPSPAASLAAAPAKAPATAPAKANASLTGSKPFVTPPDPPADTDRVGWACVREGSTVQWYWDGGSWTARRRLTAAGWVED